MESRRTAGATLIELLLYVALSSTMLFAITSWVFLSQGAATRNQAVNATELVAEHILAEVGRAVEASTAVTVPASGSSGSGLTLTLPTAGVNPTVFALSSGNLTVTEGAGSAVRLNPNHVTVSSLTFTNVTGAGAAGTVKVVLTLQTGSASTRKEAQFSKTFYFTATSKQR